MCDPVSGKGKDAPNLVFKPVLFALLEGAKHAAAPFAINIENDLVAASSHGAAALQTVLSASQFRGLVRDVVPVRELREK